MKVKELMKELSKLPEDLEVWVLTNDYGCHRFDSIIDVKHRNEPKRIPYVLINCFDE